MCLRNLVFFIYRLRFFGFAFFALFAARVTLRAFSYFSSSTGASGSNISPHSLQITCSRLSLCTMFELAQSGHSLIWLMSFIIFFGSS